MYEDLYNVAKENDLDFVKSDFNRFVGKDNTLQLFYNKLDPSNKYYNKVINLQEDQKPFYFIMNTWSGIYKREYLNKYNIRHNETPGASFQDNGFWLQTFWHSTRAYFIDKPYYMNRRDNPNSSVKNKDKVMAFKVEYDYILNLLKRDPVLYDRFIYICQYMKFRNYLFNYNRIDVTYKKYWLKIVANEYKQAYKNNEIKENLFPKQEFDKLCLIAKDYKKYYKNDFGGSSLAENIFSVKNSPKNKKHKIITILGLKLKFKSKKLIAKNRQKELENNVSDLLQQIRNLQKKLDEQKIVTQDLNNKFIKQCNESVRLNQQISQLEDISRENLYANILNQTWLESCWVKHKDFTLTKGAANYTLIYILYKILEDFAPKYILELGLGQTSKLTTQYINYKNSEATLDIVEHSQNWIDAFSQKIMKNKNINIYQKDLITVEINNTVSDKYAPLDDITKNKKYNLIIIDGPFGYDRLYPRTNILDLIDNNLSDNFVIILDDAEREGEENTAKLIFDKLDKNNIKYIKSYQRGLKTQLIIASPDYQYITWI